MAEQQQTKVDSGAVKPDADSNHQEAKESSNMRSILAEIGITGAVVQEAPTKPKFRYTREQLMALSKTRIATKRPAFLDSRFLNDKGFWDPEKWAQAERSENSSQRGDEPKTQREKAADLEKDAAVGKRRTSDPKERLKEEQDGIVLGPQRRSFGTGCHVSQQQGGGRRSESPTDNRINERDAHRESNRRIGSGRFIPRERDRDRDREFGYRSGDRRERDHYDRDDRDTARDSRDGRMMRERSGKDRDGERRGGRGFRRIEEEEEPEWFSGGPTSQNETIELRGFDEAQDEGRSHEKGDRDGNKRERRRSWRKQKTPMVEDIAEKAEEEKDKRDAKPASRPSSATDHNKTKEKNIDSGGGGKKKDGKEKEDPSASTSDFDFEDLFKMDTIPGIFSPTPVTHESSHGLSGSRFGQFFLQRESSPIQALSSDASRRSSFQDEFISQIATQNANIATSSPTHGSDAYFAPISLETPIQSNNNAAKSLLEIINGSNDSGSARFAKNNSKNAHLKELSMSGKATSVQELEAGLKNLVMGNQSDAPSSTRSNISHHFSNANGQSHDNMNAFNQLLSHISDGHVTPLSTKGLSCTSLAKNKVPVMQERDIIKQGSSFVSQQQQVSAHLMSILKHAPTEQDILAGLVKGQPLPPSAPMSGTSSGQVNDALNLLVSSSQASRTTQSSSSRNANLQNNPLAKILNLQQAASMQSSGSYSYGSGEKHGSQIGRQQQNVMPQLQVVHSTVPPASSIQQQQREILAAILKQQQQQQQQVGQPRQQSPVQHPIIQQSVSPPKMVQSVMVNGPVSPRSQSPRHSDALQQAILQQQQQQQRARIPSPLVFGQTPPVITHAPSPIHPGQIAQSITPAASAMNPNTLQVHGPHVMTRVPSPQELRAHTQQIMQNALIKKKLEEQKENYRKRQEMQGARSPNPTKYGEPTPSKSTTGLSPTLIPTSVMRKMQAGKDKDAVKVLQLQQQSSQMLQPQPMGGVLHIDGGIDKMLQANVPRPLHGQSFVNGQVPIRAPQVSVTSGMPSQLPLQGRRIIKSNQNLCNQGQRVGQQPQLMGSQPKSFLPASGNLDIAKQLMIQQQQAVAQRQLNVSPMSSSSLGHSGLPIRGANPMHSSSMSAVRSGMNLAPNNYLLRNMVHSAQPTTLSQLNQLAILQQQQQQRGVDPRQLQVPAHLHPVTMQQLLMGVQNTSQRNIPLSAGTHPTGVHQQAGSILGKSDPLFPLSASASYPAMNSSFNNLLKNVGGAGMGSSNGTSMSSGRHSPMGNLDKWFGKDLKQKMPNLPPVPTQRAQYVEEVEQRQQATTVQN